MRSFAIIKLNIGSNAGLKCSIGRMILSVEFFFFQRCKNIFLNPYPDYVVLILMTLYAMTFVLFVNKKTVIIKAFDYAKSLIEVCERI